MCILEDEKLRILLETQKLHKRFTFKELVIALEMEV